MSDSTAKCGECDGPLVLHGAWVSSQNNIYLRLVCQRCGSIVFQQGTGCTKEDDIELIAYMEQ